MGGGGRESNPTYDLADFAGGAKYWYVDPSARQQYNPMQAYIDDNQGHVDQQERFGVENDLVNRKPFSNSDATDALYRIIQNHNSGSQQSNPVPQGMTHFPNTEFNRKKPPYGTGVIEEDGTFWVVPVSKGGYGVEDRFMDKGEHFGGFNTLEDALRYEKDWLNQEHEATVRVGF